MYVRAGVKPPASLVNGTHHGHHDQRERPVGAADARRGSRRPNMNATVIADKFVPASQLCTGKFAAACKAAGISG